MCARLFCAQVSDGDCFAMGGVAGHAGLFAPLGDVAAFALAMLRAANDTSGGEGHRGTPGGGAGSSFPLNGTTARKFVAVADPELSSRALGWDTNLATVADYGFDGACGGGAGPAAFLHIGYTGTCLCVDPGVDPGVEAGEGRGGGNGGFWSVVLTNRAFNCQGQLCPAGSEDAVKQVYRDFNSHAAAVVAAMG